MAEISELEVLEGDRQFDFPAVIIDADTARKAIEQGELTLLVDQALKAMDLSGQRFAILRESE